jgi:hypothetical protein
LEQPCGSQLGDQGAFSFVEKFIALQTAFGDAMEARSDALDDLLAS